LVQRCLGTTARYAVSCVHAVGAKVLGYHCTLRCKLCPRCWYKGAWVPLHATLQVVSTLLVQGCLAVHFCKLYAVASLWLLERCLDLSVQTLCCGLCEELCPIGASRTFGHCTVGCIRSRTLHCNCHSYGYPSGGTQLQPALLCCIPTVANWVLGRLDRVV
jgi:hypothetical protein